MPPSKSLHIHARFPPEDLKHPSPQLRLAIAPQRRAPLLIDKQTLCPIPVILDSNLPTPLSHISRVTLVPGSQFLLLLSSFCCSLLLLLLFCLVAQVRDRLRGDRRDRLLRRFRDVVVLALRGRRDLLRDARRDELVLGIKHQELEVRLHAQHLRRVEDLLLELLLVGRRRVRIVQVLLPAGSVAAAP